MNDPSLSRRDALRSGVAGAASLAGITSLAGCAKPPSEKPTPAPSEPLVEESFEDGLEPWSTRGNAGPEVPKGEFEWRIERSQEHAHSGEWSLSIFTEGDHDDGTAWATRKLTPPSSGQKYQVSAQAWSPSESFNTLRHFVMYLGPNPPTDEGSFPGPDENSTGVEGATFGGLRETLHQKEGWKEYSFEWLPAKETYGDLYLSVGVSVVWEADATHFVDDVRVEAITE